MTGAPMLMLGKVLHKRLTPKVNGFTYCIYYLSCPISRLGDMPMARNRPGFLSFYDKDHGARDGSDLEQWIHDLLLRQNIPEADGEITLVTFPRVLGYVFNPVSFWLCHDKFGNLRAVLCEVNNTFGESHNYVCRHDDRRPLLPSDWITGEKFFHVSPFLKTEGTYHFRFRSEPDSFAAWIDHSDAEGQKKLLTSVHGRLVPMTSQALRRVFWAYPLVTFKAIFLIHMQALRLLLKGIKYVQKPPQKEERLTVTRNIT